MDEVKDSGAAAPAPRTGRGVRIALILSLTLNLLVLGIVGGSILAHGWRDDPRRVRDVGFGPYTEALSPEDREALRDGFMKSAPDFRKQREAARADVVRLADAIRAEPFDRAAVAAVMDDQAERIAERMHLGRGLLLDRLEAMGPEARMVLADRIESMRLRRHD
jgi:uncharacterized membrane protein